MLILGSHVSFTKDTQLVGSLEQALSYRANTFMFYTGAPQNTMRFPISKELTEQAMLQMKEHGIDPKNVIIHAPYIINLANRKEEDKFSFSVSFLKEELVRCQKLGIYSLVLHPGSHVGEGEEKGLKNIIDALNLAMVGNEKVTILLETMAGKGTELGKNLEEIEHIIQGVKDKKHIGVCIDTCHLNDAGYDLTKFDDFLNEFDQKIGLSYLKCIHINDSKNSLGAHKDRHANLGFGTIGWDTLLSILYHPRLENIPKILETPWVLERAPYKKEIEMVQKKKFSVHSLEELVEE